MKTSTLRKLATVCHGGLLIWVPVWHYLLSDAQSMSPLLTFAMWVVPLLLPIPGMLKDKPYTYAWANFVVMWYLLHGFTAVYAVDGERLYALVEIILAIGMFVGCSYYARLRGKEQGVGLPKLKQVMQEEKDRFECHSDK
ncbi:DUF2069 domain-containing protein [Aestuariibacter halophilus]|uniref:DUF2069 domain-containing protein n=1 Tax=Fluctibacter halophilus TaxID=226011 RepID=A0ABS8G4P7_9ALTE|nr:DUF2069 domain-containing protein [Aestuariibacter halophilus]MCC2615569.1 DUF2069 domain-containing protein [Aestuariibacter halophilus]